MFNNFPQPNTNRPRNLNQNTNANINFMNQNPNTFRHFNNNNNNNFNNMNMMNSFNNNNMNMNFVNNNMINQPNMNINNNNIYNMMQNSVNFKKDLLRRSLTEKDPVKIQMKIALGLNNNRPYENYLKGGNQTPAFMKQSSSDNIPKGSDDKINVVFQVMKGNIHNRAFNKTDTIQQMLLKFIKSLGLLEKHLDNIYFLFNATNLNTISNKNQTLVQYGIKDGSRVTIIDLNNIIGA